MEQQMILKTGKENGFTLLEIVVVIIVLGFLMGVMLPTLSKIADSTEERAFEQGVINIFMQARGNAVIQNETNKIQIGTKTIESKLNSKFLNKLNSEIKKINSDKKEVLFYSDGTSSGLNIEIFLLSNRKILIKIDEITGKVMVEGDTQND
ncbi:hypothetical protein HLVA_03500 [Haliovirga abyssi]|uniref:Prepilin-type N-terminal cleavage/methylation domain-containing protein n=2 Tax=Haliovirga abyssi TaxID=2996794 RepID=A0AAU9D1C2_9FUSO|nr:hypothetical protein HLVA_03500 [Haliovirga abyssi]